MKDKKNKILYLTQAAMIGAIYILLTYIGSVFDLSYGNIQFRFSEALTILPLFSPAAVPGLALGCFISNTASPYGLMDMFFGSFATLIGAILTRAFRNIKVKNIPILSVLAPVFTNAIILPLVLTSLIGYESFNTVFLPFSLSIAISEFLSCTLLGIPLYLFLLKSKLSKNLFKF